MKRLSPPIWLESILLLVVPERDRESIAGDLHEEYSARYGRARANFWYGRQVFSFVPHHAAAMFARSPVLAMLCGFTALCGLWLGLMGLRLKHAGYGEGELIAATIVLQAWLTLLALCFRNIRLLRWFTLFGSNVVTLLALQALISTLRGAHLEGYVLLIAVSLLVQAFLTFKHLRPAGTRRQAN